MGDADAEVRWIEPADDETDRTARADGFVPTRELLQMRRPLPVDEPVTITTRAFRPGLDDEAWVVVNNRAFAWHPDQAGRTVDDLRATMAEPWFDAAGFLLHEVDGRLAGFCWTKVHADHDPPLGEIFVIGVDPDFTGRGLGRALTLAGLDHLFTERGTSVGMLYVESDNDVAIGLYRSLGFDVHHRRRQYVRP